MGVAVEVLGTGLASKCCPVLFYQKQEMCPKCKLKVGYSQCGFNSPRAATSTISMMMKYGSWLRETYVDPAGILFFFHIVWSFVHLKELLQSKGVS